MKDIKTIFDSFKTYVTKHYGDKYLTIRGRLDRNHIVWVLRHRKQNPQELSDILSAVNADPDLKKNYIYKLHNGMTFVDIENLINLFNYHNYTNDSLTDYSQWVGLMSQGDHRYLRDDANIVLGFPYKDAVLKGGMDKGENGVSEPFYNNVIDRPEITELFEPKVLIDAKRYNKENLDGAPITQFDPKRDSLFIKGNNLLALYSLLPKYAGKVKLIYLDPPYNTGNDSFNYNDKFSHSTWLVFMKNRLKVAKKMLREDGSIFISCDDHEQAYLKVLCDEILGRENFVSTIVWQRAYSPQNDIKTISSTTDFVLVYAKHLNSNFTFNKMPRTAQQNSRYKNPDNDPRGPWTSGPLSVKTKSEKDIYPITTPSGKKYLPQSSCSWRFNKETLKQYIKENRIWFGKNGNNVPRIKRFLSDVGGVTAQTLWLHQEVGDNQDARNEIKKLFNDRATFLTPKPEGLLKKIIKLATKPNDIVMDFFAGSATTQAVAMKLHRKFIGIEQMDYPVSPKDDTPVYIERLQKVINGEQGGISKDKDVKWQGGGSFVYAKLMPLNIKYFDELKINRQHSDKLDDVAKDIFANAKINATAEVLHARKHYHQNVSQWDANKKFKYLWSVLDENQMYVNYNNIDSQDVKGSRLLDESSYKFNHNFYNKLS